MTLDQIRRRLCHIRTVLRVAAAATWLSALVAVLVAATMDGHTEFSDLLCGAVLVAVVSGTEIGVEVMVLLNEEALALVPGADEIAARALLRGVQLAGASQLPQMEDYRR